MNKERYARSICQTLHDQGYLAYYAGGFVRDQLLGIENEDIDIATDADPKIIQSLFKKTIPLGIAFGIVVVVLEHHSYEVATFRKDLHYKDGRRPEEVAFCSPQEDAKRRDFTINGLFFDPLKKEILDFVGGRVDLKNKIVRAIGDPHQRFEEDKLRLMRACRFTARFQFKLDPLTEQALIAKAPLLFPSVSIERITQELKKMSLGPFDESIKLLFKFGLLQIIFPSLKTLDPATLEVYLHPFKEIPSKTPMILYLLELFPKASEAEIVDLMAFLKISNKEQEMALFCFRSKELFKKETQNHQWTHFYAHPYADLCQNICAAKLSKQKKEKFIEENQARELKLKVHIERLKTKRPLVTSKYLMEQGIPSGKKLGELLNKAEEIAIEFDLNSPQEVLKKLCKTSIWNH